MKLSFNIRKGESGYSLLELVATLGVLAVLVMGTIPLAQNGIKRQKEQRLRDALRQMRSAIDEFKRDTYGACPQGAVNTSNPTIPGGGANAPADPRSRVVIDDCKIFDSENLDRYPPSLQQLVDGVKVKARGPNIRAGSGIRDGELQATEINEEKEIIKVYLREIPKDPITGEAEWRIRSSYQPADSENWDDVNVFDVRSTSDEEALNGEKYSDW
ncbi:MAG: type II secretion system protein [Acidobacteria bacterium]|nr:type II secretion system protein [Acidobacteriota bacterium]MBK9527438.1 type II secretion system protein [Acidobacteriota bacterium]MBP7474133.1 type II secretion system protein [Pyrinomonadaceae bacterium]MBP9108537.1 type II secretion system protein [Pyrinomonadaceae bacterium]